MKWPTIARVSAGAVLSPAPAANGGSRDEPRWTVLRDCRLVTNDSNDGDSVHVSAAGKEYIFRLYVVDAPETGTVDPSRLLEQAKYFGINAPQLIDVGAEAKKFTAERLAAPF